MYSVVEDNGVVIVIENMTPHLERDVTVQFYTVDGSAVGMWHAWSIKPLVTNAYIYRSNSDGTDFIGVEESYPQVLTFSPNETLEFIIVPITDDTIFEGNEEFSATLTTTDAAVRITQPNATVRITENDGNTMC